MKRFFSWAALLLITIGANAQVQISVQKDTDVQFFATLEEAITNAASGAVITLPGGAFESGDLTIHKTLRIVGIGHKSDANPNGAYTRVTGNLTLAEGANNCTLEGLYWSGNIKIGTVDDAESVVGTTISRCHIVDDYAITLSGGNTTYPSKNILLSENILESVDGVNVENVLFLKNIFKGGIAQLETGATFRNNIFLYQGPSATFISVSNATFENNIFLCSYDQISNSTFVNNIFVSGHDYNFEALDNNATGNITGELLANIFVNVPDQDFSYLYDYHLQATSAGKSGGSDGTDIGIYGTNLPFKDACTPDIPHIDSYNIGSSTDNQGRLNISIKVSAQGN